MTASDIGAEQHMLSQSAAMALQGKCGLSHCENINIEGFSSCRGKQKMALHQSRCSWTQFESMLFCSRATPNQPCECLLEQRHCDSVTGRNQNMNMSMSSNIAEQIFDSIAERFPINSAYQIYWFFVLVMDTVGSQVRWETQWCRFGLL